MEIREIVSELILAAQNVLNDKGQPENFDLEDFIYQMEGYLQELDEIGEFYYETDMDVDFDDFEEYED